MTDEESAAASRRTPRPWLLYGSTLVLPFVFFLWALPAVSDHTIGNDYVLFAMPQQMELQYSVTTGTWPLFSADPAGGRSASALTLGQPFHPLPHVAARLPGYWNGHAIDIVTALRMATLGITHLVLLLLLLRLTLPPDLAFILSLVTVYNLRMLDAFRFGASLENYTAHLLLFAFIVFHYLAPSRRLWPVAISLSACLLVVGGHPQIAYFGFLACAIGTLAVPFVVPSIIGGSAPAARRTVRFYLQTLLFVIVGVALASAYALPLYFDYVAKTPTGLARGYEWSLLSQDTWGGLLNSFFYPLSSASSGAFGSSAIICGVLVLPVAFVPRSDWPKALPILWCVFLGVGLLSLGDATPLYGMFWRHLPLANAFREPGRIGVVLPVLMLLMLAWLFSRAEHGSRLGRRRTRVSAFGVVFAVALALFVVHNLFISRMLPGPGSPFPYQFRDIPSWVQPLSLGLGAVTLVLAVARGIPRGGARAIGAVLSVAVVAQAGIHIQYGTWRTGRVETPTLEDWHARKRKTLDYAGPVPLIKHNLALSDAKRGESFIDKRLAVFYRSWLTVSGREEARAAMARERRSDVIIVEGFDRPSSKRRERRAAPDLADTVILTEATVNRLVFRVSSSFDGFIALTYLDDSGKWQASVDSVRAQVYSANHGEQAVFLAAGQHDVEFRYFSRAAFAGMAVSLGVLMAMMVAISWLGTTGAPRSVLLVVSLSAPAGLFVVWFGGLHGGDDLGTEYAWSSEETPEAGNVAFGRKTRMSSIATRDRWYRCYSGLGVDGDTEGDGFRTRRGESLHWWRVDLGREWALGRIAIHGGQRKRRGGYVPLRILLSTDGEGFEEVPVGHEREGRGPWRVPMEGRSARFVRLESPGPKPLHLREVEVYPWDGRPDDAAEGGPQAPTGRPDPAPH